MRVAFFGTPAPAVPALQALLADPRIDVPLVVTNPDRPAGRGHRLQASPVKVAATAAGIPVAQPSKPTEISEQLSALRLDAGAVVAYGQILPPHLLAVPASGFVNLHFSLLPAWRGAAPVQATILHGDRTTGVTCFLLDAGMDTGPILATRATPVGPTETAGELQARLADLGAPVLVEAIVGLVAGSLPPLPQDHDRATYAPKVTPAAAELDWAASAEHLERCVRAFQPAPGAHTGFAGGRLKVHSARIVPGTGEPGLVIAIDQRTGAPVVAARSGALRLDEVQPAGKRRMRGAEFVNGYQPLGQHLHASQQSQRDVG